MEMMPFWTKLVAGFAVATIKIDHIHWHIPHYTPSIQIQGFLSKQILSKTPTELRYIERSVFMRKLNNQNLWNFGLGSPQGMNVPIWIIIGFQQRDRQDAQNLNIDTFLNYLLLVLSVLSGQKIITFLIEDISKSLQLPNLSK